MTVTFFDYPGCPHCALAKRILRELQEEEPACRAVSFAYVDETARPDYADGFDYWYTPSLFLGDRKLYEASPVRAPKKVRAMLKDVLDGLIASEA